MKKNAMPAGRQGFTVVELMVSIGILTILFALTTINLTRLPSTTSQSSSYERLVSDLRGQQTKSMVGYNAESYGVYFDTAVTPNKYVLFTGLNYSGGTEYYPVELDPYLTFTSVPPTPQVVFLPGSGDVSGLTGTNTYSFTISDSLTGDPKAITINKYGATE
jgi:prepilin-type N-terminal cleavage/methylation domain-containing protein